MWKEKIGLTIPFYNVFERIPSMLDASETSLRSLKKEISELIQQQQIERKEQKR